MNLQISGITGKEKKVAYLNFDDGNKSAEIRIPDCKILNSKGFTQEELKHLEIYTKANKEKFWEQAKQMNPMKAFMKER